MHKRLWVVVASLLAASASAQNLRVITVPWLATDPTVPHAAYNGHPTILKAIARGGNGTYVYEWDFEGDGVYDFTATTTNRYDLSTRYSFPNQTVPTTFNAKVRVTSNGQTAVGLYPVRVFADVPADPANATDRQLQVMRNVAIDDGLWYLHNQLVRSGNEDDPVTGAQITGNLFSGYYGNLSNGYCLEALGRNQHYPAFPPAYLGELPDPAANAARWATDPYAEDAARLINRLLSQATVVSVAAADEANLTGFYPERSATPIAGTDDGIGLYVGSSPGDLTTGPAASALRGLAVANLQGYVAQVGDANRILGRRFEHIVQQLVDGLVWAQNDTGFVGSWYYTPNAGSDQLGEYAGGVNEVIEALWMAEQWMGSQGVIVPNLAKARVADYLRSNMEPCPTGGTGGTYVNSFTNVCDFALTATDVFGLAWVGADQASATDTRLAFPSYNALTRAQLRTQYDSTLTFIGNTFLGISAGSIGWDRGFVENGDFGRTDGLGDHYAMVHWARAARVPEPELRLFGTNDYARLFARYLVLNQAQDGGWNWTASTVLGNHSDDALGPNGRACWALLTLSPDTVAPVAVITGIAGDLSEGGTIQLSGTAMAGGGMTYRWDFGNGDVFTGPSVSYAFPDSGTFDVTLTTTSASGQASSDAVSLYVANAAPTVNAGADLVVDEGSAVSFEGAFTDPGVADTHAFDWDFGDAQHASTLAATHVYPDDGVFQVSLTVTDDDLGVGSDLRAVTVRNVAPTITSTPSGSAAEGVAFQYTVTFTDPGADTQVCSAPTLPVGAALTGCTVDWIPTAAQTSAPVPFRVCVTDDDGGQSCQPFEVSAAPSAPAAWATPTVVSPQNGTVVATLTPELVFLPDGNTDNFDWELAPDETFVEVLASGSDVSQTRVSPPAPLTEDARYCWRVRADDGVAPSAWASACFRVSATDSAPPVPALFNPADGGSVTTYNPVFSWSGSVDPEGSPVSYDLELTTGTQVVTLTAVSGTAAMAPEALTDGATYSWRVRAVTATGPASAYSAPSAFTVAIPEVPAPVSRGCGCSSSSGGVGLVGLLAVLALRRRRLHAG